MLQKDDDPQHARQVTSLALQIFDRLFPLHHMVDSSRVILEAAALMHDIGWPVSRKGHHKHAARLIKEHQWQNASPSQALQAAALARYHRKGHPKSTHEIYNRLAPEYQQEVRRLAAMLRIADGLDRSHLNRVSQVWPEILPARCVFHLGCSGPCDAEIWGAERKSGLFREVFELEPEFRIAAGRGF